MGAGRGARMTAATAWRTDGPCPVCGTGLFVLDDGQAMTAECRLCDASMAARRSLTGGSMRHWQPDRSTTQGPGIRRARPSFFRTPTCGMRQDPSRVYPATSDIRRQLAASGCGRGSGDNLRKEAHKSRPGMVLPRWAEGVGFEPTMTVTSHSGFQDPYGNRSDLHRYPVRLVASARIRHDQGPGAPGRDPGRPPIVET